MTNLIRLADKLLAIQEELVDFMNGLDGEDELLNEVYSYIDDAGAALLNFIENQEEALEEFMDEEDRLAEERGEQISDERRAENEDHNPFTEEK